MLRRRCSANGEHEAPPAHLLAGTDVFEGRTAVEVCNHHLHTRPVPPSARLGRPLPGGLEALVLSCLEKDADRRPQSAHEFTERLLAGPGIGTWGPREASAWWARHGRRATALRKGDAAATAASAPALSLPLVSQCAI